MKRKTLGVLLALAAVFSVAALAVAQRWQRDRGGLDNRVGIPQWENDPQFADDVFTFVRVRYRDGYGGRYYGGGYGWRGKWAVDYPDSDLNFSFRLQQLTSLKVNPEPLVLELTDERLFDYPFLYLIEPGNLLFDEAEVVALRRYLTNGGFLMVDDFWGEQEWNNFYRQIKRVFPDREPVELPLEHPIFHYVYDLSEKPQIPSIHAALSGRRSERWDATEAHYRAIFDDSGRMMAIICHNTDLGDGWEREGENEQYFHEYSEKWAYPLGINIVMYAMTH